jgi:hypothetical protein
MDSFTDIQGLILTPIVSRSSSVTSDAFPNDLVPKYSMLSRRTTSISRVAIAENAPATLSFHNINYVIGATVKSSKQPLKCPSLPFCKPREPNQILFDVSGQFTNGLNAILGKIGFTFLFENDLF